MANGFEVTKLYATIVPRLASDFKAQLQKQILAVSKTANSKVAIKARVEVDKTSLKSVQSEIDKALKDVTIKVNLKVNSAQLKEATQHERTITLDGDTSPMERKFKASFQKIENSSLVFSKGISSKISQNLSDGFRIAPGNFESIEAHTKKIGREAERAAKKVEGELNKALKATEKQMAAAAKESKKFEKFLQDAADNNIELDVELGTGVPIVEAKIKAISRDRKVELKLDVDKSFSSQLGKINKAFAPTHTAFSALLAGAGASMDVLGKSFGRLSDISGVVGVIISTVSKGIGTLAHGLMNASRTGSTFASVTAEMAANLGAMAASVAATAAVAGVVIVILALVAALVLGAVAVIGFVIASVVLGAVVSALAVGITAVTAAVITATAVIAGLAGAAGVLALALMPVVEAFQAFLAEENATPPAAKAATKAVSSQASAIRAAGNAVTDAHNQSSNAAYGVVQAQRAVRDSGVALEQAYYDQRQARERLTQAEEAAKENLIALGRAARDVAGEEEDARIRLIRAQERLQEVTDDSTSDQTDYREALRTVEEAQRNLSDTQEDGKKKVSDFNKAKKLGVKGDQNVVSATRGVVTANNQVRGAIESRRDAEHQLQQAQIAVTRAQTQEREAVLRLKEAQVQQTAGVVGSTAAQRKQSTMFGKLTADGQKLMNSLKGVYGWVSKLSGIAQKAFFPGLQIAFGKLKVLAPIIETAVKDIGGILGDLSVKLADAFSSKSGQASIKTFLDAVSINLNIVGGAVVDLIKLLMPAMGTLTKASKPLVDAFADGLVVLGGALASLFKVLAKPAVMKGMSAVLTSVFNVLGGFFIHFGGFMEKISGTLTTSGPALTLGLDKLMKGFFDVLAVLVNSGLMESFFVFMGQMGDVLSEMAANGSMEALGKAMSDTLLIIGQSLLDLAKDPEVIKSFINLFKEMAPAVKTIAASLPTLLPAMVGFLQASVELFKVMTPDMLTSITAALIALRWVLIGIRPLLPFILFPLLKIWQGIKVLWGWLKKFWNWFSDVYKTRLKKRLDDMGAKFSRVWARITKGVREFKTNFVTTIGKLRDAFSRTWNTMKSIALNPIDFIINTVYNKGIVPLWNSIGPKIGMSTINEMSFGGAASQGMGNNPKTTMSATKTQMAGAYGGKIPGSSGMRFKDDRVASSPRGPIALAGGEYIVNAPATQKWLPVLQHINQSGRGGATPTTTNGIPGLAGGGWLEDLWEGGKKAAGSAIGKVGSAVRGVMSPAVNFAANKVKALMPDTNKKRKGLQDFMYAVPHHILDKIKSTVTTDDSNNQSVGGGPGGGSIGDLVAFGRWLQGKGYDVSEHPSFGGVQGGHAQGSYHYKPGGQAIDVNHGSGTSSREQSFLSDILADAHGAGLRTIFMTGGHYNHLHADLGSGNIGQSGGDKNGNQYKATPSGGASSGNLGSAAIARRAIAKARSMGANHKVLLALMEAGLVESNMRNLNHGDRDSLGFLQQRASWGSAAQRRNIEYATSKFVNKAKPRSSRYATAGALAQAVQVSALPWKYGQRKSDAMAILRRNGISFDASGMAGGGQIQGFSKGGLVSGFGGKTGDRILAALSDGEFVMNAAATKAIGSDNLADANMAARGGPSKIRANTSFAHAKMGSGNQPAVVDNSRHIQVDVTVVEDAQVDLLANRLNAMM